MHTPFTDLIFEISSGDDVSDFPLEASILICGSKELLSDLRRSSSPLNTDKTMIRAAVLKAIPPIERIEIILMKLALRFDTRYRRAMKNGRFNVVKN
jgi:hypothetical protein